MEILFNSIIKKQDGTVMFDVTSPYMLKRDLQFIEDNVVYAVVEINKLSGSDYIAIGALGKRQRFKADVIVAPITIKLTGTVADVFTLRNFPTAADVQRNHRLYYLESIVSALIKPSGKDMYG